MSQTITVNVVNSVSTGSTSGYFLIPGNFTTLFYPGFKFLLFNGSEELPYTVVSSTFSVGFTQVNVNTSVKGSITALGAFTPGSGPFVSGTYTPAPTSGGTGTGAQLTVVIAGPGPINTLGTIVGGTQYQNGNYVAVPLTGGTGTGAQATIVVEGGFVTQVVITTAGTGYAVGDTLSAAPSFDGIGLGSGFSVPVATVLGTITSVTLANQGLGYSAGDTLTFGGVGYGGSPTLNTVVVTTVTSNEQGSITLQNNQPMFTVGQQVYVISAGNASCQTPWWSMLPTTSPIPAVQAAQVLAITVYYSNQNNSPTTTYSVRLGNQPGAASVDQSEVYVDLPTAIAAYEAQLAA